MKNYEKEFQSEKQELIVLVQNTVSGGTVIGDLINPSVVFLAAVNTKTGELYTEKGRLDWYIKNKPNRKGWGFDLQKLEIYHVLVKKCIEKELQPYQAKIMNNRYLLLKIIKKNVHNDQLEQIRDSYTKPIEINNKMGFFKLNRQYGWFEGTINWLDNNCNILLNIDVEDGITADNALDTLSKLIQDNKTWDSNLRNFAAEELIHTCNVWRFEEDENATDITKEEFAKRISLNTINIYNDGTIEFEFYDDDLFLGHSIIINANINGKMISADIAG